MPDPLGLFLEAAHELFANERPLALRLRDVLQLLEKPIGRVEMDEPQPRAECSDDLLRLICTQQTCVDEDAGEAIADRARDERSGDGRVDPAGKRADRATVADPVADLGDGLFDERGGCPVAGRTADAVEEVAKDLRAVRRVGDLRMKLHRIAGLTVGHRGDRHADRSRDD